MFSSSLSQHFHIGFGQYIDDDRLSSTGVKTCITDTKPIYGGLYKSFWARRQQNVSTGKNKKV